MLEIKGISASDGIAIGKAFLFQEVEQRVPEYLITTDQIEQEIQRYHQAVQRAVEDLQNQIKKIKDKSKNMDHHFLEAHILMLNDIEVHSRVKSKITIHRKNSESAVLEVSNEFISQLESMEDVYLRERALDLKDVSRRVLRHLLKMEQNTGLQQIREPCILVCHNLMPSDAVSLDRNKVLGIVMDLGGRTTHTAILARSFEIPAVLGIGNITAQVEDGDQLILDGAQGLVIVNPDEQVIKKYYDLKKAYLEDQQRLLSDVYTPCYTTDKVHIRFKANIEDPSEVDSALHHGAEGVGLYRSEFLYIRHGLEVNEESQFQAYKTVLEGFKDKEVTIRTLDLGADKLTATWSGPREANPILGWRAIRFCLKRPDVFKTQLRALLRASIYGNLRIMFPLISGVAELESVLGVLEEVKQELRSKGITFKENIPMGTMIEVPSAVMVAEHLAKRVQFFSIGTNDLIQYSLAVDRGNEKIADLYDPLHPGVLKMIKRTIQAAKDADIECSICGEMAGDPSMAYILLGLGIEELSMSPVAISQVKSLMRNYSRQEAEAVVNELLQMPTSSDVAQLLIQKRRNAIPQHHR